MVDFVDVLVERAPVEGSMRPVVPCVFEDEECRDLIGYGEERGKGHACRKAKVLGQWVEQP